MSEASVEVPSQAVLSPIDKLPEVPKVIQPNGEIGSNLNPMIARKQVSPDGLADIQNIGAAATSPHAKDNLVPIGREPLEKNGAANVSKLNQPSEFNKYVEISQNGEAGSEITEVDDPRSPEARALDDVNKEYEDLLAMGVGKQEALKQRNESIKAWLERRDAEKAKETPEQRLSRFKEVLKKTNFNKFLRMGLMTLIPLLLGRDQGGSAQYSADNPQVDKNPIIEMTDFQPQSEIFKAGHKGLIADIGDKIRVIVNTPNNKLLYPFLGRTGENKTDPFFMHIRSDKIETTPLKSQTETLLPYPKEFSQIKNNEPGESLKGWAEKIIATMSDPALATETLVFAKNNNLPAIEAESFRSMLNSGDPEQIKDAWDQVARTLAIMEGRQLQLSPDNSRLAQVADQFRKNNPALIKEYTRLLVESTDKSNPDSMLSPDETMYTRSVSITNAAGLLQQAKNNVASSNQQRTGTI